MLCPSMRQVTKVAFVLAVSLGANSRAAGQARPQTPPPAGALPDILGIRTGMSPQEAYDLLKAIDPAKRVNISQVTIPDLLGDKPAVYAMAPETFGNNNTEESIYINITLPPNPQQVWQVFRALTSIHTTRDEITASLRQKYGMEHLTHGMSGQPPNSLEWFFNEQGRPSGASISTLNGCTNSLQPAMSGLAPSGRPFGVGVTGSVRYSSVNTVPPLLDPAKTPQCNGLVWVRAVITGGLSGAVFNYNLEVTTIDYTLQHRTAIALNDYLNNVVTGQQQQLNKAKQQAVPKL